MPSLSYTGILYYILEIDAFYKNNKNIYLYIYLFINKF